MTASLEVRRDDGELVGLLVPVADQWQPCTVFGAPVGHPQERVDATAVLQSMGLSYLAENWQLREGDDWVGVEIVEAGPRQVTVRLADISHPDNYGQLRKVPAPVDGQLRMGCA